MTRRMCSCIASRSSDGPSLLTQSGSCACQTSVWPRTCCLASRACSTIASAAANANSPRVGSTAYHFISFSGVTEENCAATIWR
jgi:hypothetical protein